MKPYYLYKITNKVNDKCYIGITKDVERRMRQHFNKTPVGTVSILKSAILKYGRDSFTFDVICIGNRQYILDLEVSTIELYRTREKKFGYNIKPGGASGAGYTMPKTSKDVAHYVSGFWFPNVRCAITHTGIDKATFQRRRKAGTLGDTCHNGLKSCWSTIPAYVGGFWFSGIYQASMILNVTPEAINSRIRSGSVEQSFTVRQQTGNNNHMFGIRPEDHPSSKRVSICGVIYNSIKQATEATGYSKYIINKRASNKDPDFAFIT